MCEEGIREEGASKAMNDLKSPSSQQLPQSQFPALQSHFRSFYFQVLEMLLNVIIPFCFLALHGAADLCNWTGR